MKLSYHYPEIKEKIIDSLRYKELTHADLAIYFKDIQYNKMAGDFNRACTYVGFQFNRFWLHQLVDLQNEGIQDSHIKTLYRKFFIELGFKS